MLILLGVVLFIAWLLGYTVFHVASAAIHILIVLALVAVFAHFVKTVGRSASYR